MNPLRSAREWLLAPTSQTERVVYRLGRVEARDTWKRASRFDVLRSSLQRRLPSPEKWLYTIGLRDAHALPLPDLLCIGAPKAGTTWLYENLARHPEVFVPPDVKEVHYFDFLFHQPLADYAAVFEAGRDRVKCDITPNYGRLRPSRIAFLRRVMPEVKLVFMMRNPVERAWSQAVMDLSTRDGRAFENVSIDELRDHYRTPAVVRNGLYTETIDRWLAAFPEERLLMCFYEDVEERPRELLSRIFEHLGLSPDVDWPDFPTGERVHAGPDAPIPEACRAELEALFADEIARIARRFGGPAGSWIR